MLEYIIRFYNTVINVNLHYCVEKVFELFGRQTPIIQLPMEDENENVNSDINSQIRESKENLETIVDKPNELFGVCFSLENELSEISEISNHEYSDASPNSIADLEDISSDCEEESNSSSGMELNIYNEVQEQVEEIINLRNKNNIQNQEKIQQHGIPPVFLPQSMNGSFVLVPLPIEHFYGTFQQQQPFQYNSSSPLTYLFYNPTLPEYQHQNYDVPFVDVDKEENNNVVKEEYIEKIQVQQQQQQEQEQEEKEIIKGGSNWTILKNETLLPYKQNIVTKSKNDSIKSSKFTPKDRITILCERRTKFGLQIQEIEKQLKLLKLVEKKNCNSDQLLSEKEEQLLNSRGYLMQIHKTTKFKLEKVKSELYNLGYNQFYKSYR
ncbi:hypothetical protein DLAC_03278 [Tieghemostelium lacteum]|uniref:Uncharacterized protein n=1 Tax=Tieghemostelium lacteum TaxID=361077 RepID=A0A152A1M4_TIELA|nr:hypothetical protein DLAC_03278 [Tieghemostelium lacteum]|eukprot:KYR00126.1 hypothetical protein DLAC_03278 [Tieghemostelium lacteum]